MKLTTQSVLPVNTIWHLAKCHLVSSRLVHCCSIKGGIINFGSFNYE